MQFEVMGFSLPGGLLTLGTHAQEGYCSRPCVSVCLSVKSHPTSVCVRPENTVTYSAGNEGRNICGVFSETALLQRSSTPSVKSYTFDRPFSVRKHAWALSHSTGVLCIGIAMVYPH